MLIVPGVLTGIAAGLLMKPLRTCSTHPSRIIPEISSTVFCKPRRRTAF